MNLQLSPSPQVNQPFVGDPLQYNSLRPPLWTVTLHHHLYGLFVTLHFSYITFLCTVPLDTHGFSWLSKHGSWMSKNGLFLWLEKRLLNKNYLRHRRWTEVKFSPLSVCLSVYVCLFFCEQDISKSCEWIQTKFGGEVGCVTRKNWFDFGEDPKPDTIIF